jgi:Putative transposase
MAETAAHLVDHMIPKVPVRQWVLSLPIPLRLFLAAQPDLSTPVLQVVQRVLYRYIRGQVGLKVGEDDCGSVTLIQRFGSAANLNIHLHCLVLDGAYRTKANGEPEFIEIPAPSDDDVWELLQSIIKCVMKQLVRRGVLVEDHGETYLANDEDKVLGLLAPRPC